MGGFSYFEKGGLMKWEFIDPGSVNPSIFGFQEAYAVKVKKHSGDEDVRNFTLKGWETFADLVERHPVAGKILECSTWFIWAAKGR